MLNMLRPYPARERRTGLDMTDVLHQPKLRRDCYEMIKVRATDSSLLLEPTISSSSQGYGYNLCQVMK